VLGISAALHGDEVNGAAVVHRLFDKLDASKLSGHIVALPVTNVPAFHAQQRRTPHGFDLNHNFPGKPDGNDVELYAHRLMERFVTHLDMLVDLHTASRGRANSLYIRADMTHEVAARMAYLQRPQIILHNPAADMTLRGAAHGQGVAAITVEVGNPSRFQPELIRSSVVGLRSILSDRGMLHRRPVDLGPPPVICRSSHWLYTEHGGLLDVFPKVNERVEEGQPIARIVDAFGRELRTWTAPHDGIVIGRAVDPVAASGARILHLGRLADDNDPLLERHDG
jgi:predicted deacylase